MSVIEKLDSVLARLSETSEGDYLSRLANGTSIALEAVNLLRDHGRAIRQDMIDADMVTFLDTVFITVHVRNGRRYEAGPGNARSIIRMAMQYQSAARATGEGEGHD